MVSLFFDGTAVGQFFSSVRIGNFFGGLHPAELENRATHHVIAWMAGRRLYGYVTGLGKSSTSALQSFALGYFKTGFTQLRGRRVRPHQIVGHERHPHFFVSLQE